MEGIIRILRAWQQRDGLHGLPIGPEGSGILGNAFLMPVDEAIIDAGVEYLRWTDDLLAFARRPEECCAALDAADDAIQQLRLRRSREKTELFHDLEEAREEVRDGLLVSLGSVLRNDKKLGARAARAAFDGHVRGRDDAEPHRFRYILRALRNLGDDYAARPLAECPASMNIDPKCSTEYLESVGLDDDRVAASILGKLQAVPEDRTDALDLHLLRAMSPRTFGDAEGAVFERIATDGSRRPPVRAWAFEALSRTPRWKERGAMEAIIGEPDPAVRRAILIRMRGGRTGRRANFLRHVREHFPDLQLTSLWVEAS